MSEGFSVNSINIVLKATQSNTIDIAIQKSVYGKNLFGFFYRILLLFAITSSPLR